MIYDLRFTIYEPFVKASVSRFRLQNEQPVATLIGLSIGLVNRKS